MIDVSLYGGLRIIRDINLTDHVEDWSRVRSPGRARRRRKLGHPQNIVYRLVPKKDVFRIGDTLVMHPEIAKLMEEMVSKQMTETSDRIIREAISTGCGAGMLRETGGALTMEHIERARRLLWP